MKLNKYIDHTLLKPDATDAQIATLCHEAEEYEFCAVCVNSCHVKQCHDLLEHTPVKIASVVGFPLGAMSTAAKAAETEDACLNGASEIDMVINIGKMKSGDTDYVKHDIYSVCEKARLHGAIVKVILETCLLTESEIIEACRLAEEGGALFVKTSTGFSDGGATKQDVSLLRDSVPSFMKVKASGGIRDYDTAIEMISAGADRIGTSSGIEIIETEK